MNNKKTKSLYLTIVFFLGAFILLAPLTGLAKPYTIKESYCGAMIGAEYCKCAFHNDEDMCDRAGMEQSSASMYVQQGWEAFLAAKQQECTSKQWLLRNNECFPPPDCTSREVFIAYDWACYPISDFCGEDPIIKYNLEKKLCYCPIGYELIKDKGDNVCEKIQEIDLSVQIEPGYPNLPLLANGLTKTRFKILATYTKTGSPVDMSFRLGYEESDEAGKLELLELNIKSGSILEYTTPDADDFEKGRIPINTLKITYYSYIEKADKTIDYKIPLFTSQSEMLKIMKEGFETKVIPIISNASKLKIEVTTSLAGKKYPINEADLILGLENYQFTYKDGTYTFDLPDREDKTETIEVTLDLSPATYSRINKTKNIYIKNKLFHDEITGFLTGIKKELAESDRGDDAKDILAKLKSLSYSLALISGADSFSKDISANIGNGLGSMIWDIVDTVSALFSFSEKARVGIAGVEAKSLNLIPEDYETLKDTMNNMPGTFLKDAFKKMKSAVVSVAPGVDPGALETLYHSISETGITKGAQFSFNFVNISGMVSDSFYSRHKDFNRKMVVKIANGLRTKTIDHDRIDQLGAIAVSDWSDFNEQYLAKTNAEYNRTFIKDTGDLIRGTVIEGLKISFPGAMTVATKALDGVWGGIKTLISADIMVTWYKGYGENQFLVRNGIDTVMHTIPAESANLEINFAGINKAHAIDFGVVVDSRDSLQAMYDNQVEANNPDRAIVIENYEAKADLDFYSSLATIMEIVEKMDPQTPEAAEVKASMEEKVKVLQQIVKETDSKIKNLDIIKPKVDKKMGWVVVIGWMFAVLIIPWLIFIWKRSKEKSFMGKIWRLIGGVIVWLMVLLTASYFIGTKIADITGVNITEELPQGLED